MRRIGVKIAINGLPIILFKGEYVILDKIRVDFIGLTKG
jgi:hypothetical protein